MGSRDDEAVDLVRRRLVISGGKYVVPAIVVTLTSGTAFAQASCNPVTCMPACMPAVCSPAQCKPSENCNPDLAGT